MPTCLLRPSDLSLVLFVLVVAADLAVLALDGYLIATGRDTVTARVADMPRMAWALVLSQLLLPGSLAGHFFLP